jgi:hypothetical protein
MKTKQIIIILIIILTGYVVLHAQEIHYDYDEAGNRIERKYITLKSASAGIALDSVMVEEQIEEFKVMIYPNPTRGVLKVVIQGTEVDFESSAISIYNMQGALLYKQKPAKQSNEINLQNEACGMYFLKLLLNKKVHNWTVIKQE